MAQAPWTAVCREKESGHAAHEGSWWREVGGGSQLDTAAAAHPQAPGSTLPAALWEQALRMKPFSPPEELHQAPPLLTVVSPTLCFNNKRGKVRLHSQRPPVPCI